MNQCEFCLQPVKSKLIFTGKSFGSVCPQCYRDQGYVGQCAICYCDLTLVKSRTTILDVLICHSCAYKLWPDTRRIGR